jgi:hypothetical protein
MNKNTKFYIIAGIIVIVITILILFSNSCGKKNNNANVTPKTSSESIATLTKITNVNVIFPYILANSSVTGIIDKYFSNIYQDTTNKLNNDSAEEVKSVAYSKDGDKAIVSGIYPSPYLRLYDFLLNQSKYLNIKMENVQFSKNNKIYYSYFDSEKNIWSLNISEIDGSNWQTIVELNDSGNPVFSISPKEDKAIVYYAWPSVTKKSKSYMVDVNSKKISDMSEQYEIKSVSWSPDGKNIAFLDGDNKLNIFIIEQAKYVKTDIYSAYLKFGWEDNDNIFVSTPNNLKSVNYSTDENFYSYNINSQKTTKINLSSSGVILENVHVVSIINKSVYITINKNVYELKLP